MSVLFILAATLTTQTDAAHPRPHYLVYGLDADRGEAFWFSDNPNVDTWISQYIARGTIKVDFKGFYAFDWMREGTDFVQSPAPPVDVVADETLSDVRTLTLRISSRRGAKLANAFLEPEVPDLSAALAGKPIYAGSAEAPTRLPVHHWSVPADGFELTLQLPANTVVTLVVADQSARFPQFDSFTTTARPDYVMVPPQAWSLFGDSTWVKKTFTFAGG